MNSILTKIAVDVALVVIKRAMDAGVVQQIQELVLAAFDFKISGDEKKQRVMEELSDVGGVAGEALSNTAPWLVQVLIELTVGNHKLETETD